MNQTSTKSGSVLTIRPAVYLAILCVIVAVLFYRVFLPGWVHFSNDAPLGVMSSEPIRVPDAFTGCWNDLNAYGYRVPDATADITYALLLIGGPVGFAKFYAPLALVIMGFSAWFFFRQLGLTSLACVLGGLAAALNCGFMSAAAWGIAGHTIAIAMTFLAMGAIISARRGFTWPKVALAGAALGIGVMEGADLGAIFSIFVAIFILFVALIGEGSPAKKVFSGVTRIAVVAGFAVFIAAQTVSSLIATQIQGVAGTAQDTRTKAERWDFATQWSLPKTETLGFFVTGLFGYRMDTPGGGNYWGRAGRDPAWDRYFASGKQGEAPGGFIRYGGGGFYTGVLTVLLAIWAGSQALRKKDSVFGLEGRRLIKFWWCVALISLLLAWGRFAAFYQLLYALPYFSTIRNPAKFMHVTNWALVILFAYGVHGLSQRYLQQLQNWRATENRFDRKWMIGCAAALGGATLGWFFYSGSRSRLETYLQEVQFDETMARQIAGYSIAHAGIFLLVFGLAIALLALVFSGKLSGPKTKLASLLLGIFLVVDLGRADAAWVIFWNAKEKYASNPVLDFFRDKPHERRVTMLPFRTPDQFALLGQLYRIEWTQHHFQYYNIQSLDLVQMPRMPQDMAAFEAANALNILRRWELTNTRYILGAGGFAELLNTQFDPLKRFQVLKRFEIEPKPGHANPTQLQELTASFSDAGRYAIFEFTGALPRASLYTKWKVSTNDPTVLQQWVKDIQSKVPPDWGAALGAQSTNDLATLYELADKSFEPTNTVLIAEPLSFPPSANQNPGEVKFVSYTPKRVVLSAKASASCVLLLNDKFDPNWKVTVDGKAAPILRCNFLMRGVALQPGEHRVEFHFRPPTRALYVTLTAIAIAAVLLGFVVIPRRNVSSPSKGVETKEKK
jgi:hypothetical protein